MTRQEVMDRLRALGTESGRKVNAKLGAQADQFGVKMGDLRAIAKEIKSDPDLAEELWASGNLEAMMIAILIIKPNSLSTEELDRMTSQIPSPQVADWFSTNIAKNHPLKESRREAWMSSEHVMTRRLGWSLTTERVAKSPEGLDLSALLDRLETEMGAAPRDAQWTMNFCLIEIGVNSPEHRDRAIRIGEKIGAFRDYPTSKGCTTPYAPICIPELVKRQV
ncbi:MAG TPA: DNA alkylation repair protein [Fimbriimonas sp.]|nr:DNA alkylation repair protein [Fimbriimonas sp.]